jgi:hypothetical protein
MPWHKSLSGLFCISLLLICLASPDVKAHCISISRATMRAGPMTVYQVLSGMSFGSTRPILATSFSRSAQLWSEVSVVCTSPADRAKRRPTCGRVVDHNTSGKPQRSTYRLHAGLLEGLSPWEPSTLWNWS